MSVNLFFTTTTAAAAATTSANVYNVDPSLLKWNNSGFSVSSL